MARVRVRDTGIMVIRYNQLLHLTRIAGLEIGEGELDNNFAGGDS